MLRQWHSGGGLMRFFSAFFPSSSSSSLSHVMHSLLGIFVGCVEKQSCSPVQCY